MKVITEELALPLQVLVIIDAEEVKKARDKHWNEVIIECIKKDDIFAKKIQVQGFRRGREPREMVESKLGNYDLYESAIHEQFSAALSERGVIPIDVKDFGCSGEFNGQEDYTIRARVYRQPKVIDSAIDKIEANYKKPIIRDEEVDASIQHMRYMDAKRTPTNDGEYGEGMQAIVSYEATIEGKEFPGSSNQSFLCTWGRLTIFEGLDEELKGKKAGDKFKATIKVPKMDVTTIGELEKQEALFEIEVKEIIRLDMPEIDEGWLKKRDVKNFEQLKDQERQKIFEQKESMLDLEFRNNVVSQLAKLSRIEAVPDGLVDRRIDSLWKQTIRRMSMTPEEWTNSFKIDNEELETRLSIRYNDRWALIKSEAKKEMLNFERIQVAYERFQDNNWQNAIDEIKIEILMDSLADSQSIEVNDQEIKEYLDNKANKTFKQSNLYNIVNKEDADPQKAELKKYARREKAVNWLIDKFKEKMEDAVVEVE